MCTGKEMGCRLDADTPLENSCAKEQINREPGRGYGVKMEGASGE